MKIGIDYYPEQKSKSAVQKDAELMAKNGIKLVRIGEKCWCRLETDENSFRFDWLDETISIFARFGIGVVLCIPLAYPPQWLRKKSNSTCINSPDFLRYISIFTDEFTKHYSHNKAVAGIHLESSGNVCSCEHCRTEFIEWLKDKYDKKIENLNKAFGSIADGEEYSSWEQIPDENEKNPAYLLNYYRFVSDCRKKYINIQSGIVKKNMPRISVTVSIQEDANPYSGYYCAGYISAENGIYDDGSNNFRYDFIRGILNRNFILTQNFGDSMPSPNILRGCAFQAFSHGADTIYYRWNTSLSGKDMFRYGLIDHSGIPSRCFFEFSEFCKMAMRLESISDTVIKSQVAVLYSPESEYAFNMHENMSYLLLLKKFHSAFRKYGADVDVIDARTDFSKYSLVIAPCLYINDKTVTENIYRYVINGGTLVMTARSGVKDNENNCIPEHLPTVFRELVGAEVAEYDIRPGKQCISDYSGQVFECSEWCDILKVNTARVYAEYGTNYYMGCPAVTVNDYCKGKVYYIGTVPDTDFCMDFVGKLMKYHSIPRLTGIPDGVEVTTRTNSRDDFIIFFNNSPKNQIIDLPKAMYSVIDSRGKQSIELAPYDADILRK